MGRRRLTSRQRRQRARIIRNRVMLTAVVLMLAAAAMAPSLRNQLIQFLNRSVQAFSSPYAAETVIELEPVEFYALQLGVYDNGERAQSEQQRLRVLGVPCVIWQEKDMRLIAAVAQSKERMDVSAAKGQDSFIVAKTLERVELKLSGDETEISEAAELMRLPDETLFRIMEGKTTLPDILTDVRETAQTAVKAHPENALYTQLAQSLLNWCELIEQTEENPRAYAGATMALLCGELRRTLLNG